jgi:hypothetical protein
LREAAAVARNEAKQSPKKKDGEEPEKHQKLSSVEVQPKALFSAKYAVKLRNKYFC